ncbi:uncharacterized protein LOC131671635 [Phymastichus coffea]|uniref:uncharacterized protein LOC131671635 n=1 Tax=Phymastichus coffea TaxID=108790 RepID=UPI00273BC248|nr:uncharacterized protein LOC131671635 [Phymastichus coffea]
MNIIKIKEEEDYATVVKAAGKMLSERITYPWQEDLSLRTKWSYSEKTSKELLMKELCFMINEEQIELLEPVMEEEPNCKILFGQGNLETLSLILRFKLTDMKVTGMLRSYSSSKPCKSFPYELILKDVEFEITAGLIIQRDSFCIENYLNDYVNFNIVLFYKSKDESKDIFPLDKIHNSALRKSIEKYIVEKFTKDIIIAVGDKVTEDCIDTSVSGLLDNECKYRNQLRLHKKKITVAFQKLATELVTLINNNLKNKHLSEIKLPNISGKLIEKDNGRGSFTADDGLLKSLSSLQQMGDIIVLQDDEDIVLLVFLYFSVLDISYKHLSIMKKDSEQVRFFEAPENSNSSYMKIKIHKTDNEKINLSLLDYKVEDLGYIEINWDESENDLFKKSVEPELAMWLNYTLEYTVTLLIEEKIKSSIIEVLTDAKLKPFLLYSKDTADDYDSDPLEDECEKFEEGINTNDDAGSGHNA